MTKRSHHDHGIHAEPHLRPAAPTPTPGQDLADEPHLRPAAAAPAADTEPSDQGVADEPALRWAKMDPVRFPAYADQVRRRHAETPAWKKLLATLAAVLIAGPLAVGGTVLGPGFGVGLLGIVVVGPVVEEVMKVAWVLYLAERRPWLLSGGGAIILVGAAAGLAFGAIENVLYIYVYFPDADGLAAYRWGVTMPLHAAWSTLAAVGVSRSWRRIMQTGERSAAAVGPWLVAAIVLHGGYNAAATILEAFEILPF